MVQREHESQSMRVGRNAPRSKTGCNTCLTRKIKCDEQRPSCRRCTSLQLECEWTVRIRKSRTVSKIKKRHTDLNSRPSQRPIRPLQPRPESPNLDMPLQYEPVTTLSPSTDSISNFQELSLVEEWASQRTVTWLFNNQGHSQLPIPLSASTPSIVRSLSTEHIPCANSLILSAHDRRCLEYYPSSTMVLGYLKPWQWSKLSYIYQKTASSDAIVMRMILAMSASEMHRIENGSSSATASDSHDLGLFHYNLAVRELSVFLGQEIAGDVKQRLERLLAALLFMVEYEVRFGYSRHHLRLHLQGVRSLFESYENFVLNRQKQRLITSAEHADAESEVADSQLSPLSSQLLLWISYIDAVGGQGLSSQSLLSQISQSSLPLMNLERIFLDARVAGRICWGEEYPEDEVLDDLENYRALDVIHHTFILRSRIWQLAMAKYEGRACTDTPESLMKEINEIGEKYQDLFLTARLSCIGQQRRVFSTIRCATSFYSSQVLFHRRLLCAHEPRTKLHREAISRIMKIAYMDFARDKNCLATQVSALFMAGIETDDEIHRDWILERLKELKGLHTESPWASEVLERVMRSGRTESLELLPLLQLDCS